MPLSAAAPTSLGARLQNRSQSPAGRESSDSGHSHLRPTTPTSVHSSSSEMGDNDIIPPYDPAASRTLVLCFDGTGDQFDSDNSNVVKFFSLLKKDDRREQMVYYQTGIGTYTTPQVTTTLGRALSKTLDEMVAWNLDAHVMSGYEFLMQNYEAGDKICLFGFSRGAYTARALAGMLHKIGLLPPDNFQQIPFAYKMYSRTDELGWKQSTAFKKAFCIDVNIEFIGVWDTVCSVGVIPHRLPFTTSNTTIRTFRHALSLDERRSKFKANHYNHPTDWESQQGTHRGDMPRPSRRRTGTRLAAGRKAISQVVKDVKDGIRTVSGASVPSVASTTSAPSPASEKTSHEISKTTTTMTTTTTTIKEKKEEYSDSETDEHVEATVTATATTTNYATSESPRSKLWTTALSPFGTWRTMKRALKGKQLTEEERAFDKAEKVQGETDVKEVWFAGCHCDVGGGSVPDETRHSLARIPLRWMIRECFRTRTGIRFHGELLKDIGLDPATLWPAAPTCNAWDADSFVYPGGSVTKPTAVPPPPIIATHIVAPTPGPTPLVEKTQEEVGRAEKEATRAIIAGQPFPSKAVPPPSAVNRAAPHMRDVSTSTSHTLVNGIESQMKSAPTPAMAPPGWGPDPDIDEVEEERKDARCRIYDQLSARPFWWLLELLPIQERVQRAGDHGWDKHWTINMGHGRIVPTTEKFYLHRSVKYRMDQKDLEGGQYRPRARWGTLKPTYVD
ncbi:hypothetical protein C2E23DRAFT_775632 [Lenzites betulinus]|nr:hypothetical protein C2E23DRAFT_775632 [Lenzites betulinus]